MSNQTQKHRATVSRTDAQEMAEKDAARVYESEKDRLARVKKKGEDLTEDIDDLLDDIDALLEDQEVLANYRQRGGQ